MAKGVKKIKFTHGLHYPKMTVPGQRVTIAPDQWASFDVEQWLPDTTSEEKKKPVIWMRQTNDRKIIINQLPSSTGYKFKISKRLCGSYFYYIEASMSGKRDTKNNVGLYVKGHCDPKIITSKWTYQRGSSKSIKNKNKTDYISYGHIVYLNLSTEGLNGKNVIIELWNQQYAKKDKPINVYMGVDVVDGEVNLKIVNTYAWMAYVDNIQNVEEFYIKVKDPVSKKYVKDNLGDELHAIYLNVKNKIVTTNTKVSENQTPTKVYKPDVNAARIEPCKFEVIKITESEIKDGKANNTTVKVFDNGIGLKNTRGQSLQETIHRTIFFKFDGTIIDKDGESVLNNILKFLLEHKDSRINLSGFACVIGKENYNKGLSQRRADVVKKFFGDGRLDRNRIVSVGKGEVDPTDDKMGRDNVKFQNEKDYENNRRVDISFVFTAHDAQTIIYEVVAPSISTKKDLTIDVIGLETNSCFRATNQHKKEVYVVDVGQAIDAGDTKKTFTTPSFKYKVYSDLSRFNAFPIQYIWPISTNPNQFHFHAHTCRYYSNEKRTTVLVNAYPDLKWTLEFSFNFANPAAYTHGNLPEYSRKNPLPKNVRENIRDIRGAHSKAVGSGKEMERIQNSSEMLTNFGLKLLAEWDAGQQKAEIGDEFAEKLRTVLIEFIKYKELADKVKNTIGGAVKKSTKKPPFMFEVMAPSLNASISWNLERGEGKFLSEIATTGTLNFKAEPLLGAAFTIDLLAVGSKIHPFVAAFILALETTLAAANGGITIDAIFKGEFSFDFKALTFNTKKGGLQGGTLDLGAKLSIEIIAIVKLSIKMKSFSARPLVEISAKGKFNAYFAAKITIDTEEKKGLFAKPSLEFSGMIFTFEVEVMIRGFKVNRKFGNEDEPFLKAELNNLPNFYLT